MPRLDRPWHCFAVLTSCLAAAAAFPAITHAAEPSVSFQVTSDWGSGFTASVTIRNTGSAPMEGWRLAMDMPHRISSLWNGVVVGRRDACTYVEPTSWNANIPAGGSISLGFVGSPGGVREDSVSIQLEGNTATPKPPVSAPPPIAAPAKPPVAPTRPEPASGFEFEVKSDWGSGFNGEIRITNTSSARLESWTLEFNLPARITSLWNATLETTTSDRYRVSSASWSPTLAPGETTSFGFSAQPGNVDFVPSEVSLTATSLQAGDPVGPKPPAFPTATPDEDEPPAAKTAATAPPLPKASTPSYEAPPVPPAQPTPEAPPPPEPAADPQGASPVVAAYFAEWGIYGRRYNVADIPADELTHVIYAFAAISPEGEVEPFDEFAAVEKSHPGDRWDEPLRGSYKQLKLLKERHPHLRTLIAVGGWTLSGRFSDVAISEESRRRFAASAIAFCKRYGFDGLDLDWEYPVGGGLASNTNRPEDKQNYTLLVAEIRRQMEANRQADGSHLLLTVASSAGSTMAHFELGAMARYLDWFNVMTYDFHGSWEPFTNHQAALFANPDDPSQEASSYNVSHAIQAYLDAGVPAAKIVMGVPLYSRGWSGVSRQGDGLFQTAGGPSLGTWERGILDYNDLHRRIQQEPSRYLVHRDPSAAAAFVTSPDLDGGTFMTYEDVPTVRRKLAFLKQHRLRGMMFWELSGDIRDTTHPDSIIGVVARELIPRPGSRR